MVVVADRHILAILPPREDMAVTDLPRDMICIDHALIRDRCRHVGLGHTRDLRQGRLRDDDLVPGAADVAVQVIAATVGVRAPGAEVAVDIVGTKALNDLWGFQAFTVWLEEIDFESR